MMAAAVTLENIKKAVVREASERLRSELKLGQKGLSDTEILALDRVTLISYVVALRFKSNQLTAVKHEVMDFDYKKVILLTEAEVAESDTSKGGATGGAEKVELGEQSVLLQLMLMIKNDKLDRDAKDRADMARLEAKELADMARLEAERARVEAKERADMARLESERARLEAKELVDMARLDAKEKAEFDWRKQEAADRSAQNKLQLEATERL